MADWKDILSGNEEQLSEEDLLSHLDNSLPDSDIYTAEADHFDEEAKQGLSQLQNNENLEKHVNELNQKLKQLTSKKNRKEKRKINMFQWLVVLVIFLLFICIITYVVINLLNKGHLHSHVILSAKKALLYL